MRIYYAGDRRNHQMFVAPAADPRFTGGVVDSDWLTTDGEPRTIMIDFVDGAAQVPDALGRYMVKTGQAKRTRLWLPTGFVDRAA